MFRDKHLVRIIVIPWILLLFLCGCSEREITSKVSISTEGCNFDRNTPKLLKVWLIYGNYNASYQPQKLYSFQTTISPPIPKIISVDMPEGIWLFPMSVYDNRVAVGLYDSSNRELLFANWKPFDRAFTVFLQYLLAAPNHYSINLDPSKKGASGFDGDFYVSVVSGLKKDKVPVRNK